MTQLASLLTHVFFRRVEVEGADNLPRRGPLVVVANHNNGLVDGLLLLTALRRYPRFLGKSTLWRIIPLRPFLKLAGVVPVYRRADHDGPEGPDRNEASFRTSRELLARGGVVAVFPEGTSHDEPTLQPLRTGAARIALSAAAAGTEDLATVAVGLVYDHKATFRSRALVRIGVARPVEPLLAAYREEPRAAVRALTDDLGAQLHAVVSTYRSWQEAELAGAVADLLVGEEAAPLVDRERVAEALAATDLGGSVEGRGLAQAYETYRRDLSLLGLTDAQVTAPYGAGFRRAALRSLAMVVAALPAGLLGAVVHFLPYQVMKRLGRLPRNESIKSTVKLLGCFGLFTSEYLLIAFVVRRRRGWLAAAIAFFAAPLSGYAALRLSERAKAAGGLVEGARVVRSRQAVLPTVLAHRALVVRRAQALVALAPAQTQTR